MHIPPIDNLIRLSTETFKQFLLAQNVLAIGGNTIYGFADNALIGATVGIDVQIEHIPVSEIKHYSAAMPQFMAEVFQGKLVQGWQDSLTNLFALLVEKHFTGDREFKELKKCQISLDFRDKTAIVDQMKDSLLKNFDFNSSKEKIKLINSVFNPQNERESDLANINKHIQIRNAFQHKSGKIDDFFLRELGLQRITLLDNNANPREFALNDKIELSVPEFNSFRKSVVLVAQTWRKWNG